MGESALVQRPTRVPIRRVADADDLSAIPIHLERVAPGFGSKLVPGARRHLPVPPGDRAAPTVLEVVQADVVFEGVGPRDVLVVLVPIAENDATGPVDPSRYHLAAHGNDGVGY